MTQNNSKQPKRLISFRGIQLFAEAFFRDFRAPKLPEWDFATKLQILGVTAVVVMAFIIGIVLYTIFQQPGSTDPNAQRVVAPQATQTIQALPSQTSTVVSSPTATFVPTATPIPAFEQAGMYTSTYESLVPEQGGLYCNGAVFTVEGTTLIISSDGRVERILSTDSRFLNNAKWVVFDPMGRRWGITYWDPKTGSGQTNQFAQTDIIVPTWIVDNRECHPK